MLRSSEGPPASGRVEGAAVLPAGSLFSEPPTHASFSWFYCLYWGLLASGITVKSRDMIKISMTFYAQGRKDPGINS